MSLKIKLTSPIHRTQQIYGSLKSSLGYALSVFIEFSKLRKVVSAGIAFVLAREKEQKYLPDDFVVPQPGAFSGRELIILMVIADDGDGRGAEKRLFFHRWRDIKTFVEASHPFREVLRP